MKYYYIYKITCTAGHFKGKFYFGKHTTENLDDGYKGSGVLLQKYYKKHPNDYIKEIISYHKSEKELDKAEYNIIHPHLYNKMCLNLSEGGNGGKIKGIYKHTEETKRKQSKGQAGKEGHFKGHKHTEETKRKQSEASKKLHKTKSIGTYGKHRSEETKKKQSKSMTGKKMPPRTEQWYKKQKDVHEKLKEIMSKKRWMTKENEKPIYIDLDKVDYYLSIGYHHGRK